MLEYAMLAIKPDLYIKGLEWMNKINVNAQMNIFTNYLRINTTPECVVLEWEFKSSPGFTFGFILMGKFLDLLDVNQYKFILRNSEQTLQKGNLEFDINLLKVSDDVINSWEDKEKKIKGTDYTEIFDLDENHVIISNYLYKKKNVEEGTLYVKVNLESDDCSCTILSFDIIAAKHIRDALNKFLEENE